MSENLENPTDKTSAGVLAGHLVALTLSATFGNYDDEFGSHADPVTSLVVDSGACEGMSVEQIIDEANQIIGGCASNRSASSISDCLAMINESFVDGTRTGRTLRFAN